MAEQFTKNFDVIVNGGGMVGMSLAVALARLGVQVAVVDKVSLSQQLESAFDARVSAIAYGSKCILDSIGVWGFMAAKAEPIRDIRVVDGAIPFFLHYDHTEVGDAPLGYIVENRHIRAALQQAAARLPTLTLFEKQSPVSLERDDMSATLHLQDGQRLRCRLLVAADGKTSTLRSLAGIETLEWAYDQTAIVCTVAHQKPHNGLAQERFLPAGPFAVLPMQGNRSSLVWVEPKDRVDLYLGLSEGEFVQEIQERVGGYLGEIQTIGERFSYPLSLMHAKSYTSHRLALAGDAAHGMHPIAGQGVNLGFRDVAVLSELIGERFRLGLDIGGEDVLAAYQQWRRFDNISMLAVTDGLNRLFGINLLPVQLIRGLGLWAVGKMPPLKRFLMRHAMGLVGDLPKIIKENHWH